MKGHTTSVSHSLNMSTVLLQSNIHCPGRAHAQLPPSSYYWIESHLFGSGRWYSKTMHLIPARYCLTERMPRIPSGRDPFLDTETICTRIRECFKRDVDEWVGSTSRVCFVPEWDSARGRESVTRRFYVKQQLDCLTDSKQNKIMVFSFRINVVKTLDIRFLLKSKNCPQRIWAILYHHGMKDKHRIQ